MKQIEWWGGVECTLNRVEDVFHDQLDWSGHYERLDDLDRFAAMGLRALRYPALWERWHAESDWSWLDRRLERMRELGLRPILTLVHHGSGPRHTNLLDPDFASGLAEFAARVAERYPWVEDYTPVNEPLTTARFSALYGCWYPHARSTGEFLRALLHECQATAAAMAAIRRVQPAARLVHTEDLAKTHAVPELAEQARYENIRRWLSFDLLCGRVKPDHELYAWVCHEGWQPAELARMAEAPCPPDVLGINYYVTSERFLDTRLEHYPAATHGGNDTNRYADVEAVRVDRAQGLPALLREVWERYHIPIAITEVHLGCTREEQMRWVYQVWKECQAARSQGIQLLAVTTWALLGSFNWDSLVTRDSGHYESGAFDVRAPEPRLTAVGQLVTELAAGKEAQHAALHSVGWWRARTRTEGPPLLLLGRRGALAEAVIRACELRGLSWVDGKRPSSSDLRPWAVVDVDGELTPAVADHWARFCEQSGLPLLCFSNEKVFDGQTGRPYTESDRTCHRSLEALRLVRVEEAVLKTCSRGLVVRTSQLFGAHPGSRLEQWMVQLHLGEQILACPDSLASPTFVDDAVEVALDLLLDRARGLWHLGSRDACSWLQIARRLAHHCQAPESRISEAAQPFANYALRSERGQLLPALDHSLQRFAMRFKERVHI